MGSQFSDVVTQILEENKVSLSHIDMDQIDAFLRLLENAPRVFVTGEGRSGLVMRMFAMRLAHLGQTAFVVGDVTTPAIQKEDTLVVCSGSGATTIPCLRADRAQQLGATVVAICGNGNSRLTTTAQLSILLLPPVLHNQSQERRTVQFGGSRFEQSALLFCDVLTHLAMERWQIASSTMQARHANLE